MTFANFKNARIVRSGWLDEGGRRLDCNPYMSGALEARDALEALNVRKDKLEEVTSDIFDSGRESRNWVDDERFGVRFMGSSGISLSNLYTLPLISKKQVSRNRRLVLDEGWSLITRSGTVGRMSYVRPDMTGLACSEDVLRVVPKTSDITAGYLYAFLSSKFGVPLVVSGTYGAIIQHIEPVHIADLPVPRFSTREEAEVDQLIKLAASFRSKAVSLLNQAQEKITSRLGLPRQLALSARSYGVTSVSSCEALRRLDATFYDKFAIEAEQMVRGQKHYSSLRELGVQLLESGRIKQIYAEGEHGIPFIGSGDIFDISIPPLRRLQKKIATSQPDWSINEGDILLARSGQVGGIIGRCVWADRRYAGIYPSVHILRLRCNTTEIPPGYLFAFLTLTDVGYRLIIRTASGSSIPALSVKDLYSVPVPRLPISSEQEIHRIVVEAGELRASAEEYEKEAILKVEQLIQGAH